MIRSCVCGWKLMSKIVRLNDISAKSAMSLRIAPSPMKLFDDFQMPVIDAIYCVCW
jgi:hypothetical protein